MEAFVRNIPDPMPYLRRIGFLTNSRGLIGRLNPDNVDKSCTFKRTGRGKI
jgi:hypothetical protein